MLPFSHWCFTQTLQYQNSKSNKYSFLIELGPSVPESYLVLASHRIWTRTPPDWEPADWESPWLGTRSSTNNGGVTKFYTPIHKVLEKPWKHFTSLKLCKCSQIPHPSPRVASTSNRTETNHHWLKYLQTLQTH